MAKKQVTRAMADSAANELAKIAFNKKIEKAQKEECSFGDELIRKYIPQPILALGEEYSSFFIRRNSYIGIQSGESGYYSKLIHSNIQNPISEKYVLVSQEDYLKANKLHGNVEKLQNDKRNYEAKVSDALMQLRSEARIKESFPEALPFLNFAETTMPVPQFNHLRELLK